MNSDEAQLYSQRKSQDGQQAQLNPAAGDQIFFVYLKISVGLMVLMDFEHQFYSQLDLPPYEILSVASHDENSSNSRVENSPTQLIVMRKSQKQVKSKGKNIVEEPTIPSKRTQCTDNAVTNSPDVEQVDQ